MRATLVCGPPCAGKNTYVRQHAAPNDMVIDFDAIVRALAVDAGDHDHPLHLRPFAFAARDAVMDLLTKGDHDVRRVWIINSGATRRDRSAFRSLSPRIVMVMADREVLLQRAADQRPGPWVQYVDSWLDRYDPTDVDETIWT